MGHVILDASAYVSRLADHGVEAPLSPLRLTIRGVSGYLHQFNTYRYIPKMFDRTPRHLFTPCGRFVVYPVKTEIGDEKITTPNQYIVYFRGNRVPDDRFGIRTVIRGSKYTPRAAHKKTLGRDAA